MIADLRKRALGAWVMLLGGAWSALLLYVLHPLMPYNPMSLPAEDAIDIRAVLPEGWKFFTRDPREDQTLLFTRDASGKWTYATLGPNFRSDLYFGFSRVGRAQGIEMGLLLYQTVKNESWRHCKDDPTTCLEAAPVAASLVNRSPAPTLCGDVGVVMASQLPWAWAEAEATTRMPSRVVRLAIKC